MESRRDSADSRAVIDDTFDGSGSIVDMYPSLRQRDGVGQATSFAPHRGSNLVPRNHADTFPSGTDTSLQQDSTSAWLETYQPLPFHQPLPFLGQTAENPAAWPMVHMPLSNAPPAEVVDPNILHATYPVNLGGGTLAYCHGNPANGNAFQGLNNA